jgi:hypothetical protein
LGRVDGTTVGPEIQHGCCPVPARSRSLNLRLGGSWRWDEGVLNSSRKGLSLKLLIDGLARNCPCSGPEPVAGSSALRSPGRESR